MKSATAPADYVPQQNREEAGTTNTDRSAPQQSRQSAGNTSRDIYRPIGQSRQDAGITGAQYTPQQSRLDHFNAGRSVN